MSEKFNLKWDDYKSNWTKSLSFLRKDSESADVTLISDDKVKFSAHKILLSSCSNLFKSILKGHSSANPLLYLGGVSSDNLDFILDYIYHGEIKVFQNQLESFLASAKKLEIEGLLSDNTEQGQDPPPEINSFLEQDIELIDEEKFCPAEDASSVRKGIETHLKARKSSRGTTKSEVVKYDVGSLSAEEIKDKMKELYEKIDGVYRCLACGYSTKTHRQAMSFHIETHLDGLSYTCSKCDKEFRYFVMSFRVKLFIVIQFLNCKYLQDQKEFEKPS